MEDIPYITSNKEDKTRPTHDYSIGYNVQLPSSRQSTFHTNTREKSQMIINEYNYCGHSIKKIGIMGATIYRIYI